MNDLNYNDEAMDEEPDDEEIAELTSAEGADEYDEDDDEADDDETEAEDDPISAAWGYGEGTGR